MHRLADAGFCLPLPIGVGGGNEIDANLDRLPYHALGGRVIQARAEVVGLQPDDRDLQTRVAQPAIVYP